MSRPQRQYLQVVCARENQEKGYIDINGLKREMEKWEWPLHMIDFETSTSALPFYKGNHPYEGIAFQFSHHKMHHNGRVEHADQYINVQQGFYPNIEFVKSLKKAIDGIGTIFRYHLHENNYLRMIRNHLASGKSEVKAMERDELIKFIDEITQDNGLIGKRNMVDLYELTQRYYYSPKMGGSISLKVVLPAIIHDSKYLRETYGKNNIYGRGLAITSLNFDNHVWIRPEYNMNPYKTLQPVFEGYDRDQLDTLVHGFDSLEDGGAALTAYSYLQFSQVPEEQRQRIIEALLRYCELDTLAMVMLVEGWRDLAGR